eukprot:jgi/Psemu1/36280/gm1.36280_g
MLLQEDLSTSLGGFLVDKRGTASISRTASSSMGQIHPFVVDLADMGSSQHLPSYLLVPRFTSRTTLDGTRAATTQLESYAAVLLLLVTILVVVLGSTHLAVLVESYQQQGRPSLTPGEETADAPAPESQHALLARWKSKSHPLLFTTIQAPTSFGDAGEIEQFQMTQNLPPQLVVHDCLQCWAQLVEDNKPALVQPTMGAPGGRTADSSSSSSNNIGHNNNVGHNSHYSNNEANCSNNCNSRNKKNKAQGTRPTTRSNLGLTICLGAQPAAPSGGEGTSTSVWDTCPTILQLTYWTAPQVGQAIGNTTAISHPQPPSNSQQQQHPYKRPVRYWDVYVVDNFCELGQGDQWTRRSIKRVLFQSLDKSTVKVILNWLIDTINKTITLPPHCVNRQAAENYPVYCNKPKDCAVQQWHKVPGELRSMTLVISGPLDLFSLTNTALLHQSSNQYPQGLAWNVCPCNLRCNLHQPWLCPEEDAILVCYRSCPRPPGLCLRLYNSRLSSSHKPIRSHTVSDTTYSVDQRMTCLGANKDPRKKFNRDARLQISCPVLGLRQAGFHSY